MTAFGKLVVAGVIIVLVGIGAGVYYLAHHATPAGIACTQEAKECPDGSYVARTGPDCSFAACPAAATLAPDAYPMYTGAMWNAATSTSMLVGTSTLQGFEATSTASASTNNIASTTAPFVTYYDTKLTAAGWSEDKTLDADGAGSSVRVYKKGAGVIVIGYTSTFTNLSEDTPAQCPCTVSFTIFTSNTAE